MPLYGILGAQVGEINFSTRLYMDIKIKYVQFLGYIVFVIAYITIITFC